MSTSNRDKTTILSSILRKRGLRYPEIANVLFDGPADSAPIDNLLDPLFQPAAKFFGYTQSQGTKVAATTTICYDYDIDAASAAKQLELYLASQGRASNMVIADRKNGYGFRFGAVESVLPTTDKLLILDFGTSNWSEIAKCYAVKPDLDVLIIDHHQPPVGGLPLEMRSHPRLTILNPHIIKGLPAHQQAALGYCTSSLAHEVVTRAPGAEDLDAIRVLAAIGTIADFSPLGPDHWYTTRRLVKEGLADQGLGDDTSYRDALLRSLGLSSYPTATAIGWDFVPLVNAPARFGRSDLLEAYFRAPTKELAKEIKGFNARRKEESNGIVNAILAAMDGEVGAVAHILITDRLIFAADPSWDGGIVGAVAGRLAACFKRPVLLAGHRTGEVFPAEGGVFAGSSRSGDNGIDILTAVLGPVSHHLKTMGGHKAAAGFSFAAAKAGALMRALEDTVYHQLPDPAGAKFSPEMADFADLEPISPDLFDTYAAVYKDMGPFGPGWQEPVYLSKPVLMVYPPAQMGTCRLNNRFTFAAEDTGERQTFFNFSGLRAPPIALAGHPVRVAYTVGVDGKPMIKEFAL